MDSTSLIVCVNDFLGAQLYLIALTGYAGAEIGEACIAAGFDVHLVKPGEIPVLEKLLGDERPDSATVN